MLTPDQLQSGFRQRVLDADLSSLPVVQRHVLGAVRTIYLLLSNLSDGQITMTAMSLVFTSLTAMVPLLAVSFSVLKAFGVHNQIEPLLLRFFAPLGPQAAEITARMISFVDNVKVGVLGSLGLVTLLYTAVSLISKIEVAFNVAWRVEQHRPLASRFSYYLSIILVGPVLMFSAVALSTGFSQNGFVQSLLGFAPVHLVAVLLGQLLPYLLIIATFTFLYLVIPNTRVRFQAALTGGAVAGVLWQTLGWGFARFVGQSTHYTAIYSGFAIVLVFMAWLYVAWMVLLAGAHIAFYRQHPDYLLGAYRLPELSSRQSEEAALSVMLWVARQHYGSGGGLQAHILSEQLGLPLRLLKPVLKRLSSAGVLISVGDEEPAYLPGRPLDQLQVSELLALLRGGASESRWQAYRPSREVQELFAGLDRVVADTVGARTVKDLAVGDAAAPSKGI